MFAIIETGGKQYRVQANEKIIVEKLIGEAGSKVTIDKVLLVKSEQGEVSFGSPLVSGAKVEAEIVKTFIRPDAVADFDAAWAGSAVGGGVARSAGHGPKPDFDPVIAIESGGLGGRCAEWQKQHLQGCGQCRPAGCGPTGRGGVARSGGRSSRAAPPAAQAQGHGAGVFR